MQCEGHQARRRMHQTAVQSTASGSYDGLRRIHHIRPAPPRGEGFLCGTQAALPSSRSGAERILRVCRQNFAGRQEMGRHDARGAPRGLAGRSQAFPEASRRGKGAFSAAAAHTRRHEPDLCCLLPRCTTWRPLAGMDRSLCACTSPAAAARSRSCTLLSACCVACKIPCARSAALSLLAAVQALVPPGRLCGWRRQRRICRPTCQHVSALPSR